MIINFVALDEGHVGTVESFTRYALSSPNSKGNNMSKDMHEKAALGKLHRLAAHSGREIVSHTIRGGFESGDAAHRSSTKTGAKLFIVD